MIKTHIQRPIKVLVLKVNINSLEEIQAFLGDEYIVKECTDNYYRIETIITIEMIKSREYPSTEIAYIGEYIVKVNNNFYIVSEEIFNEQYDLVGEIK